jgi:hypothetical protein
MLGYCAAKGEVIVEVGDGQTFVLKDAVKKASGHFSMFSPL